MGDNSNAAQIRSHVFWMLISAGIFAYFGFGGSWAHRYTGPASPTPNTLIPMVAVLMWTMRGGAIAFAAAAALSMVNSILGPLLYSVVGLLSAAIFVVVAIWEWTNPNGYYSGVPAILLIIFAAWNGYSSWTGLRDVLALMGARSSAAQPANPYGQP